MLLLANRVLFLSSVMCSQVIGDRGESGNKYCDDNDDGDDDFQDDGGSGFGGKG